MGANNHVTVVPEGERDTDDEQRENDDGVTSNYGVLDA
jgi:hypothetical protein